MDHLENKSFEEPRCQYAGDGLGQLFPPGLTCELHDRETIWVGCVSCESCR